MQSKKIAASKSPRAKVSAKPCMTKGVKAKTGKMTAKRTTGKNTPAAAVWVGGHVRVLGATKILNATKKPAKVAAKAKPAARPAKRAVKRKK